MQLDLKAEPYFLEALRYGVESFEGNGVDEAAYARICANSAEVGAADHAEAAGEDVRQARVLELVWRSQLSGAAWAAIGARVSPERPGL